METYLNKIKITKSNSTYITYRNALGSWFPDGKVNLSLEYIMHQLEHFKCSNNTKVLRCAVLKAFLKFYSRVNIIKDYDDILDVLNSITVEVKIPECVSVKQYQKIISVANNNRIKAILALMYKNGLREDEVTSILSSDYNHEDKTITIRHTKNHNERIICLSDSVIKALSKLNDNIKSDYLFHTASGKRISNRNLRTEIKNICTKAGYPELHAHSFRHGSAKYLLDHNVNLGIIQAHLGHKSIQTTQRYLQVDKHAKQQVANMFNNI
jgi:integrase/recombinase XerD